MSSGEKAISYLLHFSICPICSSLTEPSTHKNGTFLTITKGIEATPIDVLQALDEPLSLGDGSNRNPLAYKSLALYEKRLP